MYDLDKQTFVVLAFATAGELHDNKKGSVRLLHREEIIEIAAVKIRRGKIEKNFHSFIAIDGIDSDNLEFDPGNYGSFRATPELLIGAPAFKDIIGEIYDFIGDSIIIDVQPSSILHPFSLFKDKANSLGYLINNPVVDMWHIHTAKVLQDRVKASDKKFENLSVLQIAQMLSVDASRWTDIFAEYDIFFNPDSKDYCDRGRDDPLSWALAFAKLFIALAEWGNDTALEPIDDDVPF